MKTGLETTSGTLLVDEKLRLDPHQSLLLYVQLSGSELSAALFSPRSNTFLALASAPAGKPGEERLASFLEETQLLKLGDVSRSCVVVTGTESTLVPPSIFRPGDAA